MLCSPKHLKDLRPESSALMGLDIGKKRIGIAVSDAGLCHVFPLKTIQRTKMIGVVAEIQKIIPEYNIGGVVIGLPLNADGLENNMCESIRQYSFELLRHLNLPYTFCNERLSSFEAEHEMSQNSVTISQGYVARRDGGIDKLAASNILREYLNNV
jgi:putative Holliday junction resolvase